MDVLINPGDEIRIKMVPVPPLVKTIQPAEFEGITIKVPKGATVTATARNEVSGEETISTLESGQTYVYQMWDEYTYHFDWEKNNESR